MSDFKKAQRRLSNELKTLKRIEELFLTRLMVTSYSTAEERDYLIRQRSIQAEEQHNELKVILKEYESENSSFIFRLIEILQYKAESKIGALTVLSQVTDPYCLQKHGIDRELIEEVEKVHKYHFDRAKIPYLEGNKLGGKRRTEKQQENYDAHKEWWEKWQNDPHLYTNVTAYDESMRDKTRAGLTTIRKHRKEFEGHVKSNTIRK